MNDLDIICANCKKSESMNIGNFQLFTNCVVECRHRFCKSCKDSMKSGFKCPICNSLVRNENLLLLSFEEKAANDYLEIRRGLEKLQLIVSESIYIDKSLYAQYEEEVEDYILELIKIKTGSTNVYNAKLEETKKALLAKRKEFNLLKEKTRDSIFNDQKKINSVKILLEFMDPVNEPRVLREDKKPREVVVKQMFKRELLEAGGFDFLYFKKRRWYDQSST